MKMRIHSRIAWPFILTLVLTLAIWLIAVPLLEKSAYQKALINGVPVDLSFVQNTAIVISLTVAVLCNLQSAVAGLNSPPRLQVLRSAGGKWC